MKNAESKEEIFDKVLFIGPDKNACGGIASVLQSYESIVSPYHYMPTNSRYGTLCGVLMLCMTMLRMPFFRMFSRDKIVHLHGASGKSFVRKSLLVRWAKLLGYKVIFHCHSGNFKDYVKSRGREGVCRMLDKCDVIVALSKIWKEYFTSEFGYENVSVVNNIVSRPDSGHVAQSADCKLKLLFLGNICGNKGVFDLLDVMACHKGEMSGKVELHVGGVGEDERMRQFVAGHELAGMVKPLGWVTGAEKERELKECDVFVLPSYVEGLPVSILEAMANAKPVIATNVGAIPEIVADGKSGMLFDAGDKEAMYKAIRHFMDNPDELPVFGQAGLKMVEAFYPQRVKSQLLQLYEDVLQRKY